MRLIPLRCEIPRWYLREARSTVMGEPCHHDAVGGSVVSRFQVLVCQNSFVVIVHSPVTNCFHCLKLPYIGILPATTAVAVVIGGRPSLIVVLLFLYAANGELGLPILIQASGFLHK